MLLNELRQMKPSHDLPVPALDPFERYVVEEGEGHVESQVASEPCFARVVRVHNSSIDSHAQAQVGWRLRCDVPLLCHKRSVAIALPQQGHCPRRAISV